MAGGIRKSVLIPVAVFVLIGGALLALASSGGRDVAGEGYLDRPLPEFAQPPLIGDERGLAASDIRGEVALINVFASWCAVCLSEHPMLMRLAEEEEVALYGLNWRDRPGAGRRFLDRHGDPYVATGEDAAGRLGAQLAVTGVPETYLVDAEGRIRYRHVGALTERVWQEVLRPLIRDLERPS